LRSLGILESIMVAYIMACPNPVATKLMVARIFQPGQPADFPEKDLIARSLIFVLACTAAVAVVTTVGKSSEGSNPSAYLAV